MSYLAYPPYLGAYDFFMKSDKLGQPLTNRELDVIQLVAQGQRNKEVAASLKISPETVEKHLSNICAKYGVKGRVNAVLHYLNGQHQY